MFRQPFLPCACLAVAFGIAVSSMPDPAWSQDRSTYERLDRIERDLNMLQRQVYRGAAPQAVGGSAAANAEIRMDRIEQQMRDLTGRIEEVMNQVEQVRDRVEHLNSDVDMRVGQAPAGPGQVAAAAPPPGRPGSAAGQRNRVPFPELPGQNGDDLAPPHAAGSPGPTPSGGPVPIFGTLTPPGTAPAAPSRPAELASAAPASRGTLPNGSTSEQYNHAFGLLKQADYPAAETALKAFVESHPKDPMAGNAQYWLGETYYTRGRYLDAATAFAEGYKRYPKSPKAADGLLKLGMSLGHANQKQNACVALAQLDRDFPHAAASVKERATAEKKKLGC
jgi:tol-pal system protein YbgF